MDAREYLENYELLEAVISNTRAEIKMLENMAEGTTAQMGGERVMSTGRMQKMADAIDQKVDLEEEIAECRRKQKEIKETIKMLKVDQYNVLHKRYILNMLFKEIDAECKKKDGWATTVHGRALISLQRILDAREKAGI